MANLAEVATWVAGIFKWETSTVAIGDEAADFLLPLKQLANRTAYLKQAIEDHAGHANPHSQYLTQAEADALYQALGSGFLTEMLADDRYAPKNMLGVLTGLQGFLMCRTPPPGWIEVKGGTIGNAASGATLRANADTQNLFTMLWNDWDNSMLPIQTSAGAASVRGASAAADFAAGKRLPMFDERAYFFRARGTNDDGSTTGPEAVKVQDSFESHTHGVWGNSGGNAVVGGPSPIYDAETPRPSEATGGSETAPKHIPKLWCVHL